MEPAVWIALGAMLIAFATMLINLWKAFRERRAEVAADRERATKAGAERDSLAVHSAEAALLLMEKMLNAANANAEKLECKYAKCAEQLAELRGKTERDS